MNFEVKFFDGSDRVFRPMFARVYLEEHFTEDDDEDEIIQALTPVIAESTGILSQHIKIASFKFLD